MGYNLFQRRAKAEAAASEFATTVLTPRPRADAAAPAVAAAPPLDTAAPDPATEPGLDSLPASAAEAAVEQRPTISHIGRYALKGLIGHGGLGRVHEAWDPLLSRTVAVKTLHLDLEAPDSVSLDSLFLNEARAAAGLSHPHIVTVHDAGLSPQGVYIAMERLHGCDLRERLARGWQPTPGQAAQLVRRVADAIAYAHARGVVHCDIKPANIFLNRRDKPKVLDFGIARVAHTSALQTGNGSLEGMVVGSPHYLAPEQLQGGKVDARTDIHALGVVFYELLARRKAYDGVTLEQITSAVLHAQPPPAHELRPEVPPALSAIAARAMARAPEARHASASELALELRRWIEREHAEVAAAAAPASTAPVARTGVGASKRRVVVAAAVAIGGAATLALALRGRDTADATPQPPPAPPHAAKVVPPPPAAAEPAPETQAEVLPVAPAPAPAVDTHTPPSAPPRPTGHRARPPTTTPAREGRLAAAAALPAVVLSGALQFAISPWGEVEIDGVKAGTTPPLARLTLPEGPHTVTLRNADFPPYTTTVQVSPDKPVTVRHRFGL